MDAVLTPESPSSCQRMATTSAARILSPSLETLTTGLSMRYVFIPPCLHGDHTAKFHKSFIRPRYPALPKQEHLPPKASHDMLRELFAPFGSVEYISIPRFPVCYLHHCVVLAMLALIAIPFAPIASVLCRIEQSRDSRSSSMRCQSRQTLLRRGPLPTRTGTLIILLKSSTSTYHPEASATLPLSSAVPWPFCAFYSKKCIVLLCYEYGIHDRSTRRSGPIAFLVYPPVRLVWPGVFLSSSICRSGCNGMTTVRPSIL
jgi:hypothetical protein